MQAVAVPARDRPPRVVGGWDLTWQAVNIMIGTSVLVLPGVTLAHLRGWAPLAVVGAAVGILFVVLTFAEAAGRYSEPGGIYRYAADSFGEFVGVLAAVLTWAVRATASAAIANVFVVYFGQVWRPAAHGAWRAALLTAAILGAGAINVRGIRQAASLVNVLTIGKLFPLAIVVVGGFALVSFDRLASGPVPALGAWGRPVLLWVFAFGGFEATLIAAGEARDPIRDGPPALLRALLIVTVVYVLVQVVVAGVLRSDSSGAPVADVAAAVFGRYGIVLVAAGALLGTAGHITGSILASARITSAMADRASLPASFGHLHPRYRTPATSIVLFTLVVWVLALTGSFVWNASLSAVGRVLLYAVTALAVLRLRGRGPSVFVVSPVVHLIGFSFCVWLLLQQTIDEVIAVTTVLVAGALLWFVYRMKPLKERSPASHSS